MIFNRLALFAVCDEFWERYTESVTCFYGEAGEWGLGKCEESIDCVDRCSGCRSGCGCGSGCLGARG